MPGVGSGRGRAAARRVIDVHPHDRQRRGSRRGRTVRRARARPAEPAAADPVSPAERPRGRGGDGTPATRSGRAYRILVIAPHPFFQVRGTPIAVRSVVEFLADEGHEVDVLTYHEGAPCGVEGVVVHRIPDLRWIRGIRPGFSFKKLVCDVFLLAACLRLVGSRRFDLVHAVEEGAFVADLVRRLRGIPYVYDMDSSIPQQMEEKWAWLRALDGPMVAAERALARHATGVLTVCEALESRARELAPGALVGRVEDQSLLDESWSADGVDAPSDVPGGWDPIAMYVGNLEPYQGIDLLLDAFRLARPRAPDLRLVVIGGGPGDVYEYRARAADAGLSDAVRFLGPRPVERLGGYLACASIVVSPRLHGVNTPMKIYSYLHAGRALLATRMRGHTQVLDDRVALLADPTPAAMADGLVRLATDPGLRAALGREAGRRYESAYGREAFARKMRTFYDAVLASLEAGPPGA